MSKIWYCPNCGYEVDRGGRCHSCREALVASPLPELVPGDPDDEVGYRLDEWEDSLRGELIDGLVDTGIIHRFEDDELIVAVKDEQVVDDLIADVTGRAGGGDGSGEDGPAIDPEDLSVLSFLLDAAQRLRLEPTDMNADADVGEASALLFLMDEIPEIDPDTWAAIGRVTRRLLGALSAEEALEQEIANQAAILVHLLGPVVAALEPGAVPATDQLPPADASATGSPGGPTPPGVPAPPISPVPPQAPVPPALSLTKEVLVPEAAPEAAGAESDDDDAESETGKDGDDEDLVYEMTGWLPEQRAELALHLERAGITAQWEGDDLIVPAEREAEIDAMFELIEDAGEDDVDDEVRYHAIEELFGAADRLAHDPEDEDRGQEMLDAVDGIADAPIPFGMDDANWWQIKTRALSLAESLEGTVPAEHIRRQATVLRDLLREVV